MSYQATVVNIAVLSPGDTTKDREIFNEVVFEWNVLHAQELGIILMPKYLLTDSSSYEFDNCDILAALLWTRLGSYNGEYSAETAERIEGHIQSSKPAVLFFSTRPVVEGSVDLAQYKTFKKFREWCKSKDLYEAYDDVNELREKFELVLNNILSDNTLLQNKETPEKAPTETEDDKPAYYESSIDEIVFIEDIKSAAEIPSLSESAIVLLKEAKLDTTGLIIRKRMINGTTIKTNNKNFVNNNDMTSVLKWEAAVREMEYKGLIEDRNYNGEIYQLTAEGYRIADLL